MRHHKAWTQHQLDTLTAMYLDRDKSDIVAAIGKPWTACKTRAQNLNLKRTKGRFAYTDDHLIYIKDNYANVATQQIADHIGAPLTSVYRIAGDLGLKKSAEFLASSGSGRLNKLTAGGVAFRFPKGHQPANKGKKWSEYLTVEQQERQRKTCFPKGHLPKNTKRDGTISLRTNKRTGRSYYYIRIAQAKWKELHRYLWEKQHGPVPKGYVIAFCDGDTMFCVLSNLMMISMKENRLRNASWANLDDKYVARTITTKKRKPNKEMAEMILKEFPELITIKRAQLLLNRTIKKSQNDTPIKTRP